MIAENKLGIRPPSSAQVPDLSRVVLTIAEPLDRELIYHLRHEVYANELRQHAPNSQGSLRDVLDDGNIYLVAKVAGCIAGFISITPPSERGYSIDKYFPRETLPFSCNGRLFEIRLLTVTKTYRRSELAPLLMYAALRYVEAHGGSRIISIGRREVVEMYLRCGLRPLGLSVQAGAVTYDLLEAGTDALRERIKEFGGCSIGWKAGQPGISIFRFARRRPVFMAARFSTPSGHDSTRSNEAKRSLTRMC
jgi:hypothetical protein